jgi:dUTP pyrophosphatase
MKIQFQGHWGILNSSTGAASFYNCTFDTMSIASRHLSKIPAGPAYRCQMTEDGVLYFEIRELSHDYRIQMEVKRLSGHAYIPRRASEGAAGYDLFASEDTNVPSRGQMLIATGISINVPPGLYGRVAPRSGLAVKNGIHVGAGVIDIDYRGEVKVLLFNHSETEFKVRIGDRIAQLILERHETPPVVEVSSLSGAMTERGEGGFGSTGSR